MLLYVFYLGYLFFFCLQYHQNFSPELSNMSLILASYYYFFLITDIEFSLLEILRLLNIFDVAFGPSGIQF